MSNESKINIRLKRGNSMSYTFLFKKQDTPLVLEEGQKLLFDLKKSCSDDPIIHKDISNEVTGTAGEFIVTLKPSETELNYGVYYIGFGLQTGKDYKFMTLADGTLEIIGTTPEREV